jgi:anti-sigma B factor antagonist
MLPDEIDATNDGHIQDRLTRAQSDGAAVLVADGSGISFCGNCGVTALLAVHHRATAAGTQLRVVASPALRRIMELAGADDVLDTYPTLAAALDGYTTSPAQHPPGAAGA